MASKQREMLRYLLMGEATVKENYSPRDKLWGLFVITKPRFALATTPLNAAAAAVLAQGGYPPLTKCILGFIAVAFASGSAIVLNDLVDRRRDLVCWPGRPLPSGRLQASQALILAVALFVASLSITWLYFNPPTFFILGATFLLAFLYALYLRPKVGYLSLPPIVGLISLGGWAAFSPQTLFSLWLPWILYFLHLLWQAAHIMIYSPLHPLYQQQGVLHTESKAFFFHTSPRMAASLGLAFLIPTILLSALLPLFSKLGILYLALIAIPAVLALRNTVKLTQAPLYRELGFRSFSSVSNLRVAISIAILLDVLFFY